MSVAVAGENFTMEVVFNECQWPANAGKYCYYNCYVWCI